MRRIRTPAPTARQATPAHQRVAADRPAARVLATIVVLVALASAAGTPTRPAAGPPLESVASGSLAAFQLAVLPARGLDGGVATPDRPNPAPTAADTHATPTPAASTARQRRGRPHSSQPAWQPGYDAAGGPRAPPASPHRS
jgi:hypothetical protein